mmetsp:Transcript_26749/g.39567  ORF Transcript_26749/g.39567 Transcript_26749/m.39567 type:complete len:97 (-) Transcript_26749:49-339(-)
MKFILNLFILLCLQACVKMTEGGPIVAGSGVAVCYTACNAGYVTCMTASGLVAGTTGPVGWWAWLTSAAAGCSVVQGACMAACTAGGLATAAAPTP